jgi:hypothetical protein
VPANRLKLLLIVLLALALAVVLLYSSEIGKGLGRFSI